MTLAVDLEHKATKQTNKKKVIFQLLSFDIIVALIVSKPYWLHANNKNADQPAHLHSLINAIAWVKFSGLFLNSGF